MSKSLFELRLGQSSYISHLEGDQFLIDRLMDMGIHSGVEIELVARMPLGGPLVLRVESSFMALRIEEAKCLQIKI